MSAISEAKPLVTVVALGDSLTHSRGSPTQERYCNILEDKLGTMLADTAQVMVIDSGVGGDTAEGGLSRFDADVARHHPDIVLIEFACNDIIRQDPGWFSENLDALVSAVEAKTGARMVLCTGPYINEGQNAHSRDPGFVEYGGINLYMDREMSRVIREVADRHEVSLFELCSVLVEAVGTDNQHSEKYVSPDDGIHWTDEGNRLVATAMAEFAAPLLSEIAIEKTKKREENSATAAPLLSPEPKRYALTGGLVKPFKSICIQETCESAECVLEHFGRSLEKHGVNVTRDTSAQSYPLFIKQTDVLDSLPGDVAERARQEAYELRLLPGRALLTAETVTGLQHGLTTLTQCIEILRKQGQLPAASITDWPALAYRGVFMEDKWGTDLMTLDDWEGLVDYLAERKMNVLGVGLYGCWCVQYDGEVTEFLMVPVPGHPEMKREWTCRWYSPKDGRWKETRYVPRMFEQDFFGDLVAYGKERGVRVIPFVNSLGHNTLFPRTLPAISSKDENGNPNGYGYCFANPETWKFITSFYGSIVDKYLVPNGMDLFHIQMDEVYPAFADPSDPKRKVDPECKCPECLKRSNEERIQDYVLRLVKFLTTRGVKHVVMWNDQLTRHMDLLDTKFVERLKKEGIFDNLILHWWGYDNSVINEKNHPRIGKGLRGWVAPMTCYFNWSYYSPRHQNIANMLAMAHAEEAEGAVSYSVYDAACDFDFALMSEYAWDQRGPGSVRSGLAKFALSTAGPYGDELARAIRALDTAASSPAVRLVSYYTYTYPNPSQPYPRQYPDEALDNLASTAGPDTRPASLLWNMYSWSKRSRMLLEQIPREHSSDTVRNLIAEAARFEALSHTFLELLRIREECRACAEAERTGEKPPVESVRVAAVNAQYLPEWFASCMTAVEKNKPHYMVPSCLRDLSVMYEFLLQLAGDLKQAEQGRRAWSDIRWHVEPCVAQRGMSLSTG